MIRFAYERTRARLFRGFERLVREASEVGLGQRFPFLRGAYFRLVHLLRPGVGRMGRWTVYFHRADNAVSHALRNEGSYEPFELDLIAALLRPGDHAVDVGANIGVHTLVMSHACAPNGRVLAIEPDPENGKLWQLNVRQNFCENVELLQIAASDCEGELTLFLSQKNRGDHRVYDPLDGRASHKVSARRLDVLIRERKLKPRVFKVDVQGWETNVLAGALPALIGSHPFALVTEFWSEGLAAAGSSAANYLSVLAALDLDYYEIDEANRRLIRVPRDLAPLTRTVRETNLLGVRGIAPESLLFPVVDACE